MTAPKNVPALDGWRGLAIILLLAGHFTPLPGINLGRVGVSLFFVLSGMLMARLLFVDRVALPHFYRRRIARIVPAHLVFLALTSLAWLALGLPLRLAEVWPPLFFINNYVFTNTVQFGHIWSLSVEEHSYIVLSLAAGAARRFRAAPLVLLGGLCAASALLVLAYHQRYQGPALYQMMLHSEVAAFGLLLSSFLCVWFARRGIPATPWPVVPLLLGLGLGLHWWSVPPVVGLLGGVGALALGVNLLPQAGALAQRVFSLRILRLCGLASFSLYLWQQPFYVAQLDGSLALPLALAGAVGMGLLSYHLVENPARLFLNARWGAPQRKGGPAGTSLPS